MNGLGMYPKVIEVIEVREKRGTGTEEDPVRVVMVYCSPDGTFLAEGADPCYPRGDRERLMAAIRWALGEEGTFPERDPKKPYGWRTELRERAGP